MSRSVSIFGLGYVGAVTAAVFLACAEAVPNGQLTSAASASTHNEILFTFILKPPHGWGTASPMRKSALRTGIRNRRTVTRPATGVKTGNDVFRIPKRYEY